MQMRKSPPLEFFDLETIRLGHFMALRRINDENGFLHHYYVIGQPDVWPKRIESIAKLVRFNLLETDRHCREAVECMLYLTEQGEKIYEEFVRREATGEIRRNMQELQERRRKALLEAYEEYMELKRLSEQEALDEKSERLENVEQEDTCRAYEKGDSSRCGQYHQSENA